MSRKSTRVMLAALSLLLPALPALPEPGGAPQVAGRWVGAVIVEEGSAEVDVVVDLEQGDDGAWSGTMTVPVQGVAATPLTDVSVEGERVSWAYEDASGVALLSGTVDGDRLTGTDQESGQTFPFALRRVGPAGAEICPPAEVTDLAGVADLREVFNRDAAKTRVLLVLAPSCGLCRSGARLIDRHVLGRYPEADLAAYAVWMPISDQDDRRLALRNTCDLLDPRGRHFWIGDTALSDALRPAVGLPADGPTAWDVFLVYAPGVRWEGEQAPAPHTWMHRLGQPLPRERILDAIDLAGELAPVLQ